jgi:hypothetical protein
LERPINDHKDERDFASQTHINLQSLLSYCIIMLTKKQFILYMACTIGIFQLYSSLLRCYKQSPFSISGKEKRKKSGIGKKRATIIEKEERIEIGMEKKSTIESQKKRKDVPPLYSNLSCPFEWSAYSCIHQEQGGGNDSFSLAEKEWVDRYSKNTSASFLSLSQEQQKTSETGSDKVQNRRIFLLGDPTMLQVFISLGCLYWQLDQIDFYNLPWRSKWPCDNIPNCIPSGTHSGFNYGRFRLLDGFEFLFLPVGGAQNGASITYSSIIEKWHDEWKEYKQLSIPIPRDLLRKENGTITESREQSLTSSDTIIYNIGFYTDETMRKRIYNQLDQLGQALQQSDRNERPSLVYLTTFSQHFPTPTGEFFLDQIRHFDQCKSSIPFPNPRKAEELRILKEGDNVDIIIDAEDESLGAYHVGRRTDCTQYCQPGVPDLITYSLLDKLNSKL